MPWTALLEHFSVGHDGVGKQASDKRGMPDDVEGAHAWGFY